MIRRLACASFLVLVAIATVAESAPNTAPATAPKNVAKNVPKNAPRNVPRSVPKRNLYDGAWTVMIVTERGNCDRAYRYGIQIVDGIVHYDGTIVSFDGRVAANGQVQVTVAAAGSRADGAGRMSRDFGQGRWQGRSGSDVCTGYWEAERR
jgi:hypothetical protein